MFKRERKKNKIRPIRTYEKYTVCVCVTRYGREAMRLEWTNAAPSDTALAVGAREQ
ncbi:hypothetical protein WH47_11342 [Habropoda laboriosa]|uniref:Uncharacterized protein n=1 Tax=Habropoda laboriosa TaxID=597456 RepID=A0A0L7QLW5_9HYME|nr:hypothetical protein WH47_11342 [Habropoda laboriosa]